MAAPSSSRILAINSGSSSVKYALFAVGSGETRLAGGKIEGNGATAMRRLARELAGQCDNLAAIGHRIVHGGSRHVAPERLTAPVLKDLRAWAALDPEHLPPALAAIKASHILFPDTPQFGCFDTAFHQDLPEVAQSYPLPPRALRGGIRRYGFHGLSYAFLLEELRRLAGPDAARGRVLLAHLGSGASLAAVRGGKPVDTTMGFMPSGGLMMATRCGDIDPAVMLRLLQEGWSPAALSRLCNQQAGLLGVSGKDSDLRPLLERQPTDPRAAAAVELFCYTARKFAGAMIAALGGLDTLVFSGGIGEHLPEIRARISEGLGFAGVTVDRRRNRRSAAVISPPGTPVTVRVIPTDEERMIARACARMLA